MKLIYGKTEYNNKSQILIYEQRDTERSLDVDVKLIIAPGFDGFEPHWLVMFSGDDGVTSFNPADWEETMRFWKEDQRAITDPEWSQDMLDIDRKIKQKLEDWKNFKY